MIRDGVSPVGGSNHGDPSPGGHIAPEWCLREAGEACGGRGGFVPALQAAAEGAYEG